MGKLACAAGYSNSLTLIRCLVPQPTPERAAAVVRIQSIVRMHLARLEWVRSDEFRNWTALEVRPPKQADVSSCECVGTGSHCMCGFPGLQRERMGIHMLASLAVLVVIVLLAALSLNYGAKSRCCCC